MAKSKPQGMVVPVVQEEHRVTHRRAADPAGIQCCCQGFEAEFGKAFRLLPGGGVVPARLRLERVKIGKTVLEQPKTAWKYCPLCGLPITVEVAAVVKTSESQT